MVTSKYVTTHAFHSYYSETSAHAYIQSDKQLYFSYSLAFILNSILKSETSIPLEY